MNFEVVLDVFSGRSNPVWDLSGKLAEELVKRLRRLPPAGRGKTPSPPDLGYRGLRLTQKGPAQEEAWLAPYEVFGGFARHGDSVFLDDSRSLERWLLSAGGPGVEQELRKRIMREIEH